VKDIRGQQDLGQEDRKTNSAGSAEVTERRRGNCGITVGAMGREGKVWVFSLC